MRSCLILLLLASCVPTTFDYSSIEHRARYHPPRLPQQVEVFYSKRPARPYDEVGLIQGQMDGDDSNQTATWKLQEYAAQRGCDAVVLMGVSQSTDWTVWYIPQNTKNLHAACIVYKPRVEVGPQPPIPGPKKVEKVKALPEVDDAD